MFNLKKKFPLSKAEEKALFDLSYELGLSPFETLILINSEKRKMIKKLDIRARKEAEILFQISERFEKTNFSQEDLKFLLENTSLKKDPFFRKYLKHKPDIYRLDSLKNNFRKKSIKKPISNFNIGAETAYAKNRRAMLRRPQHRI